MYIKKQAFKQDASSNEANVQRLLGTSTLAELKGALDLSIATGALAGLIDALGIMADTDHFGCYTLAEGSLSSAMQLDSAAIWSLNLLPDPKSARSGSSSSKIGSSVLGILNRGKTPMGYRLLERWIRQPLVNVSEINERQDIVQLFVNEASLRMELLDECMRSLPDLERLAVVLENKKNAKISDLVSVYDAAKDAIPRILALLRDYKSDNEATEDQTHSLRMKYADPLAKVVRDLEGFVELVEEVVDLDSRPTLIVNAKHDEELQELRREWDDVLAGIESEHERARDEIGGDIKCEKDKVRGFVFRIINKKEEARISKIHDVHVCQILTSGVQFTTSKLKSLASDYRRVRSEYDGRQSHLLRAAIDVASTYVPVFEAATATLAELDVLLGFAHAACHAGNSYCRPSLTENGSRIILTGARHPCVELQDNVDFIPNDYDMSRETSRFVIVTGPNMGGKSTYIRQLGALAVMAQIGSFVPAEVAQMPVFDKLLVRVGAGDLQQRGVSTFMMEMLEAGAILHKATEQSLVIIDELGRGTSTYDGFGLAWAISEHLLTKVRALCVFATHFHELTALAEEAAGCVNKHVTAVASDKEITMVYQVRDGPCMESFGVHVAAMAGFPAAVLAAARRKSLELERLVDVRGASSPTRKRKRGDDAFLRAFAALPIDGMAPAAACEAVRALL